MISGISGISGFQPTVAPAATSAAGTPAAAASDFGKVLADMAGGTVDALKTGEAAAIGGITGTQSTQQVVQAVMNAEQALQTALAVRDKLVAAYQEISRMAI
jgi:flagellar hook-basal body complex protein FliE